VVKAAEKSTAEAPAAPSASARDVLPLSPTAIEIQYDGHVFKECFVRAHEHLILQDFQDSPTLWRKVQSVPGKALRALDRVTVLGFDMSWMIKDVVVTDSDPTQVKLAIRPSDIIRMGAQSGTWQDDRHIVRWAGTGYGAFRLSDGVAVLPNECSSLEAAKGALFAQHYTIRRAG
jgi:hypothetical protein